MRRLVKMREPFVYAIDRDCVLNQIVRADAEEIHFARERGGLNGGARDLDHRAQFHAATFFRADFLFTFLEDFFGMTKLFETGNHREHGLPVADRARANDRAQLRFEDVDVLETKTNCPPAEKRIEFVTDIDRSNRELVAAEIERANNERIRVNPLGDFSVSLVLLFFARQRVAIHEKKFSSI